MAVVKFFAPDTDAFVSSVERHIGEFEAQTGHTAQLQIIGSDEYFSNKIRAYLEGDSPADVFMSGPVLLWEHVGAGLVEPLDDYVRAAREGYHFDDFLPALIEANRWSGRFGDPLGAGPLLEIPVNCESYNLAVIPETLALYDVPVPQTWDDYFSAARRITERSRGAVRGFGQRGVFVWHTIYTGFATQFWSYGAADFDPSGRCAIASPAGVKATRDFIEALKSSGPLDWTNQRWYELALDFAVGKYGLLVDSDHYVAFFEDPSLSKFAGRTGYALPPAGPTGLRRPNLWTWSLVMNARSSSKPAAWDFIEWASGRDFLLRSAFEGNMNPTRASVWDAPSFVEHTAAWGDFARVSRQLVDGLGRVLVTPAVHYLEMATRWTQALQEAYLGSDTVEGALQRAARDIDRLAGEPK